MVELPPPGCPKIGFKKCYKYTLLHPSDRFYFRWYVRYILIILTLLAMACKPVPKDDYSSPPIDYRAFVAPRDTPLAERIVAFAKTLKGTRYQFGCSEPGTGFDCSGFITYVFHHFNIDVPRSSVDFTDMGTPVEPRDAMPGDLILFTGTNSQVRTVGHIGLVTANDSAGISFIHSSSGKENAVIITTMNEHYKARFVKIIRITR